MLYTIGYSSFFEPEELINRLKAEKISYLFDVRTFPYSNAFPQYNKEDFSKKLHSQSINYNFLGDFVGGLIVKNTVRKGINSLKDLIKNEKIKKGLNYLYKKSKTNNIAVMCAEKSPFDCHRFLAVASTLHFYTDAKIKNIIADKTLSFEESIELWKKENKLQSLKLKDEELILQRLIKLYKIDNKREEKFPTKIKNLKLF